MWEAVLDARSDLPKELVLDGSYQITRVLGSGGFGITYEAIDLGLGRTVALKEHYPAEIGTRDNSRSVRPRTDNVRELFDKLKQSFIREARTLSQFKHPGIVRVLRVFEAHGTARSERTQAKDHHQTRARPRNVLGSAMTRKRTAILISGRGSNMQALVRAMQAPDFPAETAVVIANRPEALGLSWAAEQGIPTVAIDHRQFANRMAFEARLHQTLLEHKVELVCLAGFMRLLTGGFVDRWRDRLMNIHPSLLPSFPGLDTHQRALDAGALIAGCTVHFVRTETDSGPILAQAAVAVLPGDTAEALAARVLEAEHRIYPLALQLVASGQVRVENETTVMAVPVDVPPPLIVPAVKA